MHHLFAMSIFLACLAASASGTDTVRVRMTGLPDSEGLIYCALHDAQGSFPQATRAVQGVTGTIDDREGHCAFEHVASGSYAVSAFHDRNGNRKLDTGLFGIPKEPWATSRDARASFGPPSFADARFDYGGGGLELTVMAQ